MPVSQNFKLKISEQESETLKISVGGLTESELELQMIE